MYDGMFFMVNHRQRKRPEVAAHVAKLRVETPCRDCGGGPIEWHAHHHHEFPNRRVANMVSHGYKLNAVLAEIAVCVPLCRSCHMAGDGRTEALLDASRVNDPRLFLPECTAGSANGHSLVTEDDVVRIRQLTRKDGVALGVSLGLSKRQAVKIMRGDCWTHPGTGESNRADQRVKLSAAGRQEVRSRRAAGETQESIASSLGISQKHVSRICLGWNPKGSGGEGSHV